MSPSACRTGDVPPSPRLPIRDTRSSGGPSPATSRGSVPGTALSNGEIRIQTRPVRSTAHDWRYSTIVLRTHPPTWLSAQRASDLPLPLPLRERVDASDSTARTYHPDGATTRLDCDPSIRRLFRSSKTPSARARRHPTPRSPISLPSRTMRAPCAVPAGRMRLRHVPDAPALSTLCTPPARARRHPTRRHPIRFWARSPSHPCAVPLATFPTRPRPETWRRPGVEVLRLDSPWRRDTHIQRGRSGLHRQSSARDSDGRRLVGLAATRKRTRCWVWTSLSVALDDDEEERIGGLELIHPRRGGRVRWIAIRSSSCALALPPV
ncbi:hypothetical protein B0H17DRAFT_404012 [Mycena rosella]|uniref:Uncharacterized protein n=1 Tax=Mycena rosella TaxID=1033263 RepID=A0AAD7FZX8_MYCRO|nr:hypothetical protein B0H17DRAFT_404012 [Mycena rosella]